MGLFNGLKWEHGIYDDDFSSRKEFSDEIDHQINELENRKSQFIKYLNKDYNDWENCVSKEKYDDALQQSIQLINNTLSELYDFKEDIR